MEIKRKTLFISIPIIVLITVAIFYLNRPIRLPKPEKIIVYNEGVQKELDKNSEDFNKILELTNKRFKRNLSIGKDIVDDKSIEFARSRGVGIEFVYSRNHFMFCTHPFIYDRLYFDLFLYNTPGTGFAHAMSGQYLGHSLGNLTYSKNLVDLVTNIK